MILSASNPLAPAMRLVGSTPHLVLNRHDLGVRVLTSVQRELRNCDSFRFCVAFVNRAGVATLQQLLDELQVRGTCGRVLVSQYLNFTEPVALRTLLKLRNLDVRIATEGSVHAKGYYFARGGVERYMIGSSNWTAAALCTNTELNIQVETHAGSPLALEVAEEFDLQFGRATPVTQGFIDAYEKVWTATPPPPVVAAVLGDARPAVAGVFQPNRMQVEALAALAALRTAGKRKALIISATGTGKTFLSAFDVQAAGARQMLFVVHRENIARAAMASFKKIFGARRTYGLYTGNDQEQEANFLFATVQTMSRARHLERFAPDQFDYIVVDESHRAGAASYARFLNHFEPRFLLGMTATPERTDGADIFSYFDHNIAYEIRLQRALEEEMLCPFHYFGVTDLTVNGEVIDEYAEFNRLTASERVARILEKTEFYGCDDGVLRGLVFCSRVEEAQALSAEFNRRGYRTLALDGSTNEEVREQSIRRLEADRHAQDKLDYLFTVDIFNEGVDIPQCNQVVMLRPTQSAIVFVQQLGRGLRQVDGKAKYLTVVDFIGNYSNNYLVPVALFGDRSYDKDRLRRLLVAGNEELPGTSTIDFDPIARERIFESINSAKTQLLKDLRGDFEALRTRLGRVPMMEDFVAHDLRDPVAFANYRSRSFHAFSRDLAPDDVPAISAAASALLETYSHDACNGKSLEEPLLLQQLLDSSSVSAADLGRAYARSTGCDVPAGRWESAARSLNLRFVREPGTKPLVTAGQRLGLTLVEVRDGVFHRLPDLERLLQETGFEPYLRDLAGYARSKFLAGFDPHTFVSGFVRNRKYRRSDVFRILGATENPVAQNVGGYLIARDKSYCPLFVTYKKQANISSTTQYEDAFIDRTTMQYFTKSNRTLQSPDVQFFKTATPQQRILLFVQKSNDEGIEFYYLGDVRPDPETFHQQRMAGGDVPVVAMMLSLDHPVDGALFDYLTS